MKKVYKALYKTDSVYSDGFLIMNPDNTIEGIFTSDYVHIYELNGKNIFFLRTLNYRFLNGFYSTIQKNYEFSASKQTFCPFNTYYFFALKNHNDGTSSFVGLSLEIKEEIFDAEKIKKILLSISKLQT